jgi:broad specificity phosphatase PhoE
MPLFSRIAMLVCLGAFALAGQSTIFVSRHADRFDTEPDPQLTETGKAQAIYTTELIRTHQTAAPTARLAKVQPVAVKQAEFDELIRQVRRTLRPGESTLVVGHRGTVPRIVKALSGKDIEPLGDSEYGRLVAVTLWPDGKSSVVTLRYAPAAAQTALRARNAPGRGRL